MIKKMRLVSSLALLLTTCFVARAMAFEVCPTNRVEQTACCCDSSTAPQDCCETEANSCPMIKAVPQDQAALAPQKWILRVVSIAHPNQALPKPLFSKIITSDILKKPSGHTPVYRAGPPLRAPPSFLA